MVSSETTTASTFAAVVDILLSSGYLRNLLSVPYLSTLRSLRRICKAVKHVVDFCIKHVYYESTSYAMSISGVSQWPNTSILELMDGRGNSHTLDQKEVGYLAGLSLPKLQSLKLCCQLVDATPLMQANWPMLTHLKLKMYVEQQGIYIEQPIDIKFRSLKQLELIRAHRIHEQEEKIWTPNLAFIGPFLESCPELSSLNMNQCFTHVLASTIVSVPLTQLTRLKLENYDKNTSQEFFPMLFERNWSTLKNLEIRATDADALSFIASKSWIPNLECLYLDNASITTESELRTLLKALEKGPIQSVTLNLLHFSVLLEGFRNIRLDHLKMLALEKLTTSPRSGDDWSVDISDMINVLFDSCVFPNLEVLNLHARRYGGDISWKWATWTRTPSRRVTRGRPLPFPNLKRISLAFLDLSASRNVANYIGHLCTLSGCEISQLDCDIEEVELSEYREELVGNLGFNEKEMCDTFGEHGQNYEDSMLWNIMTDEDFKKHFVNAAFSKATELSDPQEACVKLGHLLEWYQTDPEGPQLLTGIQAEHAKKVLKENVLKSANGGFTIKRLFQLSGVDNLHDHLDIETIE